jgi:hypothetical protein
VKHQLAPVLLLLGFIAVSFSGRTNKPAIFLAAA